MTLIPELEHEIERAMAARRPRRALRLGLGLGVTLLAGGTAALAATGVIGSPANDPVRLRPHEGVGAVVPGSVRVLAVRAADPDGGPPWGLRLARTTRNLGCLEAGRVVDGRIGVLGHDGTLHPFPGTSAGQPGTCLQLDGKGQLIGSVVYGGTRALYYGLLGPEAKSIVVGNREIPTVGEEGAYLIVERGGGIAGVMSGRWPSNGPITEVRFKDGSACAITVAGPDKACVNPGYAEPASPVVDVKARIHVRTFKTAQHWHARISFRAPVAIPDASAAYGIRLSVPSATPGRGIASATARDIKAGERVVFKFDYLGGHGRYHGEVTYQRAGAGSGALILPGADGQLVGKVSFRLP